MHNYPLIQFNFLAICTNINVKSFVIDFLDEEFSNLRPDTKYTLDIPFYCGRHLCKGRHHWEGKKVRFWTMDTLLISGTYFFIYFIFLMERIMSRKGSNKRPSVSQRVPDIFKWSNMNHFGALKCFWKIVSGSNFSYVLIEPTFVQCSPSEIHFHLIIWYNRKRLNFTLIKLFIVELNLKNNFYG